MRSSVALVLALSIAACGGGKKKPTPDAPPQPQADAAPDAAPACTTPASAGTIDFGSYNANTPDVIWKAPVTGNLGASGETFTYQLQFYGGIETSLMGTFDLSAGNQANFSSCAICLLALSTDVDANGRPVKAYFQKSGSITLTEDPLTNQHLVATVSNLQMQEVTIDWAGTFMSTPVANGGCATFGNQTLDHDKVPNAFTCTHDKWTDGSSCDCMCGMQDPDCFNGSNAIAGCTNNELCFNSTCETAPANDTCQTAVALTLGTPVTGTTIGAPNNYNAGLEGMQCTKYAQVGSDVVYKVDLAAGTAYQVALTMLDAAYDGSVALVGPGAATLCDANPIATCVAGSDTALEGGDEIFTFTPTTAGTYYVIVDSFLPPGAEAGAFTLAVTAM
ncbi:MAG: PPC domain-containing protein [Deltaproteobacteria bacterium]|nr:PPC domain-containing protein [Deltaproteobacteria bacterium]